MAETKRRYNMTNFIDSFQAKEVLSTRENKVFYKEDDTFVKAFDHSFSLSDILNEALNQARVQDAGLNVPKILEIIQVEGFWAIRQEYIAGKTMETLIQESGNDEETKADLLERFVDIQMKIFSYEEPLLRHWKHKMKRLIDESGYNATIRYELQSRLNAMPNHYKICHGDFNPSNIIITPEDEAYVLDWSHVTSGNASADAALTYLLLMLEGKDSVAERYLELFCLKSDTARQYVNQWMPIVAAGQSTKKKDEEIEFLARWVDIMEFQ